MDGLSIHRSLLSTYPVLLTLYGPQARWSADSAFGVMVGAILTQNTAWSNVEQAIARLKIQDCLNPARIISIASELLEDCLKPTGYYRIKTQRLRQFCQWYGTVNKVKG